MDTGPPHVTDLDRLSEDRRLCDMPFTKAEMPRHHGGMPPQMPLCAADSPPRRAMARGPGTDTSGLVTAAGAGRAIPRALGEGGGLAQGLGIRLLAFGGAYWPLATAHSDPLWA